VGDADRDMGPLIPEPEHDRPLRLVTPMVDANAVRALSVVNRWYAAWRRCEVARLPSRDDVQCSDALYESYLRASFVDHRYDIETHPKITGSRNQPDFLLTKDERRSTSRRRRSARPIRRKRNGERPMTRYLRRSVFDRRTWFDPRLPRLTSRPPAIS
jgi:hypothetical protein